uniref:Conserved oligomeric Golgi complex subunit 6 n=1 Tax=Rhabditophanes sp. KR3021 TaxID=114890 RepID=A0AC35UHX3_9BILA
MTTSSTQKNNGSEDEAAIKDKVSKLMAIKLGRDKGVINEIDFLNNIITTLNIHTERHLERRIEDNALLLNKEYLSKFEKMAGNINTFKNKVDKMNQVCNDLRSDIKSNKEKTRDLLQKTAVIQKEKKVLEEKKAYVIGFLDEYSLTDEEQQIVNDSIENGTLNEKFFKVFYRLLNIKLQIPEKLEEDDSICALYDMKENAEAKVKQCYAVIVRYIQSDVRTLNHEFMEPKPLLFDSFKAIEKVSELMEASIAEYCGVRRTYIVRAFLDALMKDNGNENAIEYNSHDPLVYIFDMLNFINTACNTEYEMLKNLLKNCDHRTRDKYLSVALGEISEALCQPTKVRVEASFAREISCVAIYQISTSFAWCSDSLKLLLPPSSLFIHTLNDLNELALNMFFSLLNTNVQKTVNRSKLPDYDLKPINNIQQSLNLLKSILECTSSTSDAEENLALRKDIQTKILSSVLDPLNQSIQLACSKLHDPIDGAVYMINCLHLVKLAITIFQYTDLRLEMIKGIIETHEDLIVGEQASLVLTNCGLMDLYLRCHAHQTGPLSKIEDAETAVMIAGITRFYEGLPNINGFECDQTGKILDSNILESVRRRTIDHVLIAYQVIFDKVVDPSNEYDTAQFEFKTPEEIKNVLYAQFSNC